MTDDHGITDKRRTCLRRSWKRRAGAFFVIMVAAPGLAACAIAPIDSVELAKQPEQPDRQVATEVRPDPREKECLVRAMYFESNRSSDAGLLGVGTVVMNRVASPQFPDTICGVVGQERQFADGVLTSPMSSNTLPHIMEIADALLAGKRSEAVGAAMHFHTAGYSFPYKNMHYVAVAGGNAFYEKLSRNVPPSPVALAVNVPLPPERPEDFRTKKALASGTDSIPDASEDQASATAQAYAEPAHINSTSGYALPRFPLRGRDHREYAR
ncbi:cell wall hydrolase (plasmid) [Nitrobacteraceae bacterium UC4446_H13]